MDRTVRRALLALIGLLALSVGVVAPASAHPDGKAHHAPIPEHATDVMKAFFVDDLEPQDLASLSTTTCQGGSAAGYPCSNVDLEAFVSLADLGGSGTEEANDIWGWTDPVTGSEYALIGMTFGTAFVDVSTPSAPVYVGELPTHGVFGSSWRDIKTYADHAFIVSEARSHGMQVFDLTELRNYTGSPITFSETAHYGRFGSSHNIAINEDTGFAYPVGISGSNSCGGGLHAIDISTPASPSFAGCFSDDGYTHDVQCVVYNGPDTAHQGSEICLASNEDTLTIVDFSDKSAPIELSRTGYSGSHYTHQGWLTEDHSYFLLDDELDESDAGHNTRTWIVDVSDLDGPSFTGYHEATTAAIDHNQYVKGDYSYQSNYRAGLRILDVSDIANGNLIEVGYFDIWPADDAAGFNANWSNYPYFDSGIVVMSGIEQGLFVVRPDLDGGPGGDDPPSVTVTDPADGATVSGTVSVTADASDDNGVTSVEFLIDGVGIGTDNDGSDGWSIDWDTTAEAEGSHTVTATATDTVGQTASDSIAVDVDNIVQLAVHVGDLDGVGTSTGRGGKWEATVTVTVHDATENPVSGATVDGTWNGNTGGSCVTAVDGTCSTTLSGLRKKDQTVDFSVDMILSAGASYDPGSNHDPDGGSDGTTISIAAP